MDTGKDQPPPVDSPRTDEPIYPIDSKNTEEDDDDRNGRGQRQPPQRQPQRPSIIERFAYGRGYTKNNPDRFLHSDGSCIARSHGSAFPWEHRLASGEIVRYYWAKDHCLEQEPLQLEADVWNLCDKFPDLYSLILKRSNETPIEVPGRRLRELLTAQQIKLHPATYRLVYLNEREQ